MRMLVCFRQLTNEAEQAVVKARALLEDIVNQNKGRRRAVIDIA